MGTGPLSSYDVQRDSQPQGASGTAEADRHPKCAWETELKVAEALGLSVQRLRFRA